MDSRAGCRLWMMAAVLVLAGSLSVATERADAQSSTAFVSNLSKHRPGLYKVGPDTRFNRDEEAATAFTTGTDDHGYGLALVTLELSLSPFHTGTPVPEVTIRSDGNGAPGPVLFTLDNPSNIGSLSFSDMRFAFSAPPQTWLAPNTTYWLVVHATDAVLTVAYTEILDEDGGKKPGWSIGNNLFDRPRASNSTWTLDEPIVIKMSFTGVVFSATRAEPSDWDFPYSDATWGIVDEFDVGASSSGRLDATLDSGRGTGGWWKLRVETNRRYRVDVSFGLPSVERGGGIDVNGSSHSELWDHHRDDGLMFVEFWAQSESYHLQVRARGFLKGFLNDYSRSYYGPYQVILIDVTNITRKCQWRRHVGNCSDWFKRE